MKSLIEGSRYIGRITRWARRKEKDVVVRPVSQGSHSMEFGKINLALSPRLGRANDAEVFQMPERILNGIAADRVLPPQGPNAGQLRVGMLDEIVHQTMGELLPAELVVEIHAIGYTRYGHHHEGQTTLFIRTHLWLYSATTYLLILRQTKKDARANVAPASCRPRAAVKTTAP